MSKVKKIVNASLFGRTFAAIIDLVLVIFVGAGLFLGVSNIAERVNWIKAYKDDYNQTMIESGLAKQEKNDFALYVYDNYSDYQTMFYDFYHDYYAKITNKDYDIYWFNIFVYGQKDELNRFTVKELDNRPYLVKEIGASLFTYKKADETVLYQEFALPTASENGTKALTEAGKKQLSQYFYMSDDEFKANENAKKYGYFYFYALSDLTSISKLQNDYNKYALYSTTLPLVIAILIAFMIFYFIIPLIFKNGETIGKKIMHICLVNKIGYTYSRLQLLPRFIFPASLTIIIVFFMGFSIWSLMIVSFFILISYLLVIFSKDHKAIHDYFAGTLVIDARESTWFKNAKEEEMVEQSVEQYVDEVQSQEGALNEENVLYTNPHLKDKK